MDNTRTHRFSTYGFTLIEICMVLVLVGLIATAGIKGLDLIRNAQANKVVSWVRGWEQSMYVFLDRKGRYAGDPDQDGVIDASAVQELQGAGLQNVPSEAMLYGSSRFVMHIGSTGGSNPRNVFVVTKDDPAALFAGSDVIAVEKVDSKLDGAFGPEVGAVRGYDEVTLDGEDVVTGVGSVVEAYEDAVGVAYYFDGLPVEEEYLYYSPFDDPDLFDSELSTTGGSWDVSNGTLTVAGGGFGLVGDSSWEDIAVSADISMTNATSGIALVYMATNTGAYYVDGYGLQVDNAKNGIVLNKYSSSSPHETELAYLRFDSDEFEQYFSDFDVTEEHNIQVSVSENTHEVYIDGVNVLTVEDDSYDSGQVGIRTWDDDSGYVDDLIVIQN